VENVSWHDAVNFCKKLTTLDHEAKSIPATAYYTLPTEQQWEAMRGKARLHSAITSQTMERKSTVAVTNSGANQFGLFGVLGNVWEWCLEDAALKTLRGAAYNSPRTQDFEPITETTALKLAPDAKFPHTGFRCVLIPSE
jgi:formylglycine-generating enzyme required for sulfatase activity